METKMDDQPVRTAPPALLESLDASVRDIAAGAVSDAGEVQVEVRRMLADYERAHPPAGRSSRVAKRASMA
jgi:hypothetical protein